MLVKAIAASIVIISASYLASAAQDENNDQAADHAAPAKDKVPLHRESPPPCSCIRYPEFDFGSFVMYYAEIHAENSNCAEPQAAYYNGDPGINEQNCNSTGSDRCFNDSRSCGTGSRPFPGFAPPLGPQFELEPLHPNVTLVSLPAEKQYAKIKFNDLRRPEKPPRVILVKLFIKMFDPADAPGLVRLPEFHYTAVQILRLPRDHDASSIPELSFNDDEDEDKDEVTFLDGRAISLKSKKDNKPILLLLSMTDHDAPSPSR